MLHRLLQLITTMIDGHLWLSIARITSIVMANYNYELPVIYDCL